MSNIPDRLDQLRKLMNDNHIDYYYIPSTDEHNSEYVPDCWQRRPWISGFTGSAGDVLVGRNKAYLWTDPRYFLQAQQQLDANVYQLMKTGQGQTPAIDQWFHSLNKKIICGVDPTVISVNQAKRIQKALKLRDGELKAIENNFVDEIRTDTPPMPNQPLRVQDIQYAGLSASDKIQQLRTIMQAQHIDAHVITVLDAIAWLFNIRGNDIAFNPLAISYAIVTTDTATLFVDENKITPADHDYLKKQHVEIKPYKEIANVLQKLQGTVLIDPNTASWWIEHQLSQANLLFAPSPITMLKAIKNPTEQEGMRIAHRLDAIAEIKFLHWLENHWREGVTELSAMEKLDAFRREEPRCLDLSFNTISGFADHGAIVHYFVTKETDVTIDDSSLYLVDSGGQYREGTTDITRTIHLGTPTEEQKHHYTLVLKAHLAIRHVIFPDGTCGEHINALAHAPLWQEALDFSHGAGHGVGSYLCVHEGPQAIRSSISGIPLKPGMILSNEPGVYIEGEYGIRIENLCMVHEKYTTEQSLTNNGPFYAFEDLTLIPYDRKLINKAELTAQEIQWVNEYHQFVFESLSDDLPSNELREWLRKATLPL